MKTQEQFCPKNEQDWHTWLEKHHENKEAIWVVFYKKKSPKCNLSWSQAVDQALCFGWIDSVKKSIDDESYRQYFTKRKAKSIWSKVNKDKIKVLIEDKHMQAAGYKSIETAKENGSWNSLDQVEALEIPSDLLTEFAKYEGALPYFESLSKSIKKQILHWVISAKRSATREKRITELAENAANGEKPKLFG